VSEYVLVVNAGSSSLKYSLVDAVSGEAAASGLVERIGEASGRLSHEGPSGRTDVEREVPSHEDALRAALDAFSEYGPSLDDTEIRAVGHRVVHGGARFSEPVLIDDELVAKVKELIPLAPLHNPANLEGIATALKLFPDVPQVAVFDTAFHSTLPPEAYTYAVPTSWLEQHRIRRYGFHGTSYSFVSGGAAELLGRPLAELNLIVLHLGNGASACAVAGGRSVETSMGLTPLEGLVMGTRTGDIDPSVAFHLARQAGLGTDELEDLYTYRGGLLGLCGDNDMRAVEQRAATGDPAAVLALDVYCHRIRKYVGAYHAVLGRLDGVAFTAGVGEHSPVVRGRVLDGLDMFGIAVDPDRNGSGSGPRVISPDGARVAVCVVPTDEEHAIARETAEVLGL
jgi:acetate kinase